MSGFVDSVLNVDPLLALIIVGLLVFAEDALFVGFVVPGGDRRGSGRGRGRPRGRRRPVRRQAGTMTEAPGRECYRGHVTGDTAPAQEWLGWFLADEVPSRITSP